MRGAGFLLWRAMIALALMFAFYALAIAAAAALVVAPLLVIRHSFGLGVKLGLFTLVGAFIVLKSILPRRDSFEPPGPLLGPRSQPRLFAEIRRVAAATRQAEPAEVYLIPDVNAWVGQRGGLMGIGSRRVMGVGLPLLQALTVPELRAVLAHESFGPYWVGLVDPLLAAGLLPPLAARFATFLRAPWLPEALTRARAEAEASTPFDTHPPLPVRLAALGDDRASARPRAEDPPALSLLDDVSALESRLAATLTKRGEEAAIDSTPGVNPALVGLAERVEPFGLRERLATGPEADQSWQDLCARAGIAELDLGTITPTSPR